jgi:hypothetical protein
VRQAQDLNSGGRQCFFLLYFTLHIMYANSGAEA